MGRGGRRGRDKEGGGSRLLGTKRGVLGEGGSFLVLTECRLVKGPGEEEEPPETTGVASSE